MLLFLLLSSIPVVVTVPWPLGEYTYLNHTFLPNYSLPLYRPVLFSFTA
ncbi:hypothetical protein CPAR01_04145 [Colletotrichum paranaense]|uniref:Uncharacterized protein n=1 Tax=Colletotrichum paranaense TaxID=1914294 RepID=A0ABQ9SVI4_9PEZI|nr:uncharacterized protein CPAR01_04145 [Colletotrichum paranaense]KAK1543512.1 hypothetical protein CPAR01_04145 [Colletotrichum paranaense]